MSNLKLEDDIKYLPLKYRKLIDDIDRFYSDNGLNFAYTSKSYGEARNIEQIGFSLKIPNEPLVDFSFSINTKKQSTPFRIKFRPDLNDNMTFQELYGTEKALKEYLDKWFSLVKQYIDYNKNNETLIPDEIIDNNFKDYLSDKEKQNISIVIKEVKVIQNQYENNNEKQEYFENLTKSISDLEQNIDKETQVVESKFIKMFSDLGLLIGKTFLTETIKKVFNWVVDNKDSIIDYGQNMIKYIESFKN